MFEGFYTNINDLPYLSKEEIEELKPVVDKFKFKAHKHYLDLIDWKDPNDPLKKVILPQKHELISWGRLDASNEKNYVIIPGLQHKYTSTAVMLISNVCAGYCRFCFRKRLFIQPTEDDSIKDIDEAIKYISSNPKITNVLLTGGDGFMVSTPKLKEVISKLRKIPHVHIIRIGTKVLAYNPSRIISDQDLLEILKEHSKPNKRIYVMTHFNHPKEISEKSLKAADLLMKAGVVLANQTPMLKGVNDDPDTLAELFKKLSFTGITPYYVFLCRPTVGNRGFAIPVERALEVFQKAQTKCSGLAKRARLAMSHETGKIEVVSQTHDEIYFRYHRSAEESQSGDFMVFRKNPNAFWFDDYEEVIKKYSFNQPYRCYGPE